MYITIIQFAKHKNRNSELLAFVVTPRVIQVIYVCPFYNLKTVSEIFLKPCKNVKEHKIACKPHFIFDRVMALAWYKCSGGAWRSACSAFISVVLKLYIVGPLYSDTRYNDITHYDSNLPGTKRSLKRWQLIRNYARKLDLILQEIYILNIC